MRDPLAPGGYAAAKIGCRCPRLDNGHGDLELARDRGGWIIVSDCALHGIGGSHIQFTEIPAQVESQPIAAESERREA